MNIFFANYSLKKFLFAYDANKLKKVRIILIWAYAEINILGILEYFIYIILEFFEAKI